MSPTSDPLGNQAAEFAERIELTIRGVLPGNPRIASLRAKDRVVVTAVDANNEQSHVPLFVGDEHVADLSLTLFQSLDRTGQYLKTHRSDFVAHSVLDRRRWLEGRSLGRPRDMEAVSTANDGSRITG